MNCRYFPNEVLKLPNKKTIVITGHYGSGKTNLSVNLALELKRRGEDVTLTDLDIVNPYFCSAEFSGPLRQRGIGVISSAYAGSNLDTPALSGRIEEGIASGRMIIDAGGDDAGATVLGRYHRALSQNGYEMLYVINARRFLTGTPGEAAALLGQIENAARLRATGIVNNTNLGVETTLQIVEEGISFGEETARLTGLPFLFTAADKELRGLDGLKGPVFPVKIVVRKPWESAASLLEE